MIFRDLYLAAEALGLYPVQYDFVKAQVVAHHGEIEAVNEYPVKYDPPFEDAYFRLEDERTSGYDPEYLVANIIFCESLHGDLRELRFALTKELMHVFDAENERSNTNERFKQLLGEIQNKPLNKHASPMYLSEIECQWKAVLLLCPKTKRDTLLADYAAKKLADFDIAGQKGCSISLGA